MTDLTGGGPSGGHSVPVTRQVPSHTLPFRLGPAAEAADCWTVFCADVRDVISERWYAIVKATVRNLFCHVALRCRCLTGLVHENMTDFCSNGVIWCGSSLHRNMDSHYLTHAYSIFC